MPSGPVRTKTPPPARTAVFREASSWWWEPQDTAGRPAWSTLIPWNQRSASYPKQGDATAAAVRAWPGVPCVVIESRGLVRDVSAAEKARDHGIQRADDAAPEEWKALADRVIYDLARRRPTFDADDVWRELATAGAVAPPEPRALGGRLTSASRGSKRRPAIIASTGQVTQSRRPEAHRSHITVWRSLIYTEVERAGKDEA